MSINDPGQDSVVSLEPDGREERYFSANVEQIKRSYLGQLQRHKAKALAPPGALSSAAKQIVRIVQEGIAGDEVLTDDVLQELIAEAEHKSGGELSLAERGAALLALKSLRAEYGVLSSLVDNPEVNDIVVHSFDDISVQVGRRNIQTGLQFADRSTYLAFVENMLKRVGKACTLATPVIDAAVEPDVRACVTHQSLSPRGAGPMLTLRISRQREVSVEGLVLSGLAPPMVLDYLAALVSSGATSMLIAGEVATGKTTLVRALAGAVGVDEAILVIEDTEEIILNRSFVRTLLTREANTEGVGRISPAQAIRAGMRMAMNRVILGEMRDAEAAESFIDVCASGHPGMSTIHGKSARDALNRLELFLLRAQGNVGISTVRRQVANAVGVVVHLAFDPLTRARRISEVIEVGHASDGAIQIAPIFSYSSNDSGEARWHRGSGVTRFAEACRVREVVLPAPGTVVRLVERGVER